MDTTTEITDRASEPALRVSVIIPTYNRPHFLKNVLGSLVEQDAPQDDFEVVVVSDGSTDGTHEYLETFCADHAGFRWVEQQNQGPATARNRGIEEARGELVAFIDDDCLADKQWVSRMIRIFTERPEVLGVEGRTVTIDEDVTPFTHQIEGSGECYATCNMVYRRKDVLDIGGFDPSYFYGNEDVDIAWRMMTRGPVIYDEHMVVVHPPVQRSFLKFVKHPSTFGVEILLYQNHPELYRKKKRRSPLHIIFISIALRYFPGEVALGFRLSRKNPLMMIKVLLGLILQRGWLLLVTPRLLAMYFGLIKKNRTYIYKPA